MRKQRPRKRNRLAQVDSKPGFHPICSQSFLVIPYTIGNAPTLGIGSLWGISFATCNLVPVKRPSLAFQYLGQWRKKTGSVSNDSDHLLQMQEIREKLSFEGVSWFVWSTTSLNDYPANFPNIDGPSWERVGTGAWAPKCDLGTRFGGRKGWFQ